MLDDAVIVCLSDSPWDSPLSGRQRISRLLARKNHVIYVEPPEHVEMLWQQPHRARWRARVRNVDKQLVVLDLPHYAGQSYRPAIASRLVGLRAQTIRKHIGDRPFILLCFHPRCWPIVERFPDAFVCYHVYDNYGALETQDRPIVDELDRLLSGRADVIVAVSETLAEARRRPGRSPYVVHNGVDYDLFARPAAEPADLAEIPRPRVAHVGRLNPSVDFELLAQIARGGRFNVVVIGPLRGMDQTELRNATDILTNTPGLYWLGEKRPDEVPSYVHHVDACLMAYKVTEATEAAATPQKFFEYLAAGKPVVSSRMPLVEQFGEMVTTVAAGKDWNAAIARVIADDGDRIRRSRRELASANSWDTQVARIREIIDHQFTGQPAGRVS